MEKEEFADLVLLYQRSMYRFALGMLGKEQDAEDALSTAIIKAYEHRTSLRDKNKFKSWIMTIVANEAKNIIRKNKRLLFVEDATIYSTETAESQNDIWSSVMELGEQHRKIVILFYYDGFSTKEIARILKVPEGTVKSRLSRARQSLKDILDI